MNLNQMKWTFKSVAIQLREARRTRPSNSLFLLIYLLVDEFPVSFLVCLLTNPFTSQSQHPGEWWQSENNLHFVQLFSHPVSVCRLLIERVLSPDPNDNLLILRGN